VIGIVNRGVASLMLAFALTCQAQEPGEPEVTDITETTCAELAAGSELDRAFALLFYYGFLAGREGITMIDSAAVSGHLAAVRDYCNASPESTVIAAYVAALKD
jgi:hypothetical protein